jgi:hypothetical protein
LLCVWRTTALDESIRYHGNSTMSVRAVRRLEWIARQVAPRIDMVAADCSKRAAINWRVCLSDAVVLFDSASFTASFLVKARLWITAANNKSHHELIISQFPVPPNKHACNHICLRSLTCSMRRKRHQEVLGWHAAARFVAAFARQSSATSQTNGNQGPLTTTFSLWRLCALCCVCAWLRDTCGVKAGPQSDLTRLCSGSYSREFTCVDVADFFLVPQLR